MEVFICFKFLLFKLSLNLCYFSSIKYDAVGWAPKEYNPDDKQTTDGQGGGEIQAQKDGQVPQSGFVWDEASGYYYDAASGFYYDGTTGFLFNPIMYLRWKNI